MELEKFQTAKVTQGNYYWCYSIGHVYDTLLDFHCNYVCIFYRFRDIVIYFSKTINRSRGPEYVHLEVIYHGCASTRQYSSPNEI